MPTKDMMVNNIILIFFLLLFNSCDNKVLSPNEYIEWVNNSKNGLVKSETIGEIKYTVSYRPSDYNIAKALIENDSFLLKRGTKHHLFILKMEPLDGKTQILTIGANEKQEPFERINYYLSEAQNYYNLIDGKDTIKCSSYVYERYYNLSPYQIFVIGFEQKNRLGENDIKFIMEDKIFNTGKISFNFSLSSLRNIPILIKNN